jgi:hypothetical protein
MPLFTATDVLAMLDQFRQKHEALGTALGQSDPRTETPPSAASPLHRDLARLVAVANGAFERTDTNTRRAELALNRVMDLIRVASPYADAALPPPFWNTPLGVLLSRTRWWVSVDELITISNAAALAFGQNTQANRMKITRAVERGELEWVPDPSVANPQHSTRVLRAQVEHLRLRRSQLKTSS